MKKETYHGYGNRPSPVFSSPNASDGDDSLRVFVTLRLGPTQADHGNGMTEY